MATIKGKNLQDLVRATKKVSKQDAKTIEFNLTGLGNYKKDVVITGAGATNQEAENRQVMIENAGTLEGMFEDLERQLDSQGYTTEYEYDADNNEILCYLVDKGNSQRIQADPLQVKLINKLGQTGKKKTRGTVGLQVVEGTNGRTALMTTGELAVNAMLKRVKSPNGKLTRANLAASSFNTQTSAVARRLAQREQAKAMRQINKSASAVRNFGEGSNIHVVYTADSPQARARAARQVDYSQAMESLVSLMEEIKRTNKLSIDTRATAAKIRQNMAVKGGNLEAGIESVFRKDPRFQKALQLLKDLKNAGISYQEVSDESWGKDVASFATHGAVDVRGSGRKNVRGQLSNNARLAPRALKKRDTAGINKRYYAMAVTSQTAKDAKLNITTEGGVAVNKGAMPEMDRLQARRFYASDEDIDRAVEKRKKGLQKRLDYLVGTSGNQLINAQEAVKNTQERLEQAEKQVQSAQKAVEEAEKKKDKEKLEQARAKLSERKKDLEEAQQRRKKAQESLQKAQSKAQSSADKQRVAEEELAFLEQTSNRDAIVYAHLRAKGLGKKKIGLKDLERAQTEIALQPDLVPRYENGEYSMAVVRAITTEVGDKLLGSGGIKDTITQAVDSKTSARIAEKAGLKIGGKALDISAYTAAPEDINSRKFGPLAASIAQTIPNILFDNMEQYGIDKAKLQEWVKKTPLGKILSFSEESGFALSEKGWKNLEKNPKRLAEYFKKLFDFFTTLNDATSQIDGLMSEGAHGNYADKASRLKELVPLMRAVVGGVEAFQEVDDKGNLTSSGYRFTTDRLMLTTLNPASEYDYMGPSDKKRTLGETERTSMTSMVNSMGLKDKKAAKTLLAPYQLSDEQIRKQKENEALARSIVTGSAATVNAFPQDNSGVSGQMGKKRVTVGYGSGYDIDLSTAGYDLGDPNSMSFEWASGRVTDESYQKSALAFVRARVKEKVAQFLGKNVDDITEDELKQFSVFLDTSTKEGERFALKTYDSPGVANGAKMQMRAAQLDLFGGGTGSGVTEVDRALNNALTNVMASGIIEEGLAADPTDAFLQERASDFAKQADLGVLDYFSELYNQAHYNKNAEYIKNNTTKSRDYFWGAANIEAHENAEDNAVYVSPDMFKDIMRTKFGDTKEGKEQFKEFFKIVTGLQDVPEKFEAALDELTQRLMSGDASILSRVTRFPLDRGGLGDSLFTQLRVKKGEGKTVSMSSAMLKLLSGDTDGDKILAEILGIGPGTDMEGLKALYKEDTKQQILKQSNNATRALAQLQAKKAARGETVVEDATITAWASEYNDDINQMLVGPLKDFTGQFSNQFQAVRDMLADFGLDEGSIGKKKSTEERAEIGEGLMLRALTSQITQQAISAKKVAEFFVANADKKAAFETAVKEKDEETKAKILTEALRGSVDKAKTLLELLRKPDFFDAQKGHEARAIFKENLRTFGIVDDKGRLNDQTQEIVMAQLNSLVPKGKSRLNFFRQLFPEANIKADQLDEYDEKGNLISIAKDLENRFVPTIDQIIAAFLRLETVVRRNAGKEGIAGVLTKGRKNVREVSRDNVVNTAYYEYGAQPNLNYNLPEPSATGGGGTGGGGNLSGPINAQQVVITAQTVQLTGTLAGGGSGVGGGRAGITLRESLEAGDAQLLGQNPYWRVSTYAHELAKNKAYISSENGRWSVIKGRHAGRSASGKSSPLTLKEEAIANGLEKEYYADIYSSLAAPQGTYMHAAQEFMSNVQTLVNEGRSKDDRIIISSMDEARRALKGIDNARAQDIQGAYDKAKAEFVALRDSTYDPTDKGTDQIAERFRDENLEKRADALRGLVLSGNYDDIVTEYSNSQKLADGRIVTGHADYLAGKKVGDEYYATLGDFKNLKAGKKIDAAYIAQVLAYQRSAGQLMAAFDKLGVSSETTADDIINWLQGGGTTEQKELLNNIGIKLDKEGALHNFDPKAFDILKQLYFENGGNLEAAMAHMRGELDVAYDDGTLRKITGINYNDISDTLKKHIAGQADAYETEVALKELQKMADNAYGYQSKKGSPAFQKAMEKLKDLYDAQFQLQKYEREKGHTVEGTQEYKRLEELIKATQAKVDEAKAAIKTQKDTGEGGGVLTDEEKKKLDEQEKEDQEKLAKIKADDENLENKRNARTSEYIKLMQKAIELKEKLYKLDKQIEAADKKGDDTHVLKAKRKGLEDERKEIVSGMKEITGTTSSRWSAIGGRGQKEAERGAFNQKELRRIDIARHQKKTLLSGERAVYDAEFGAQNQVDTESRYQKLLNERLRLESKGMSAQHKLQLSYNGQEKGALQEVIRLTQQKIALLDKELGILRESGFMRDDQVADIEREYQLERAINVAGEAGKNGGAISVWGMMKNDMSRAMARVFDYGIAMRALNSIPQAFRKIYDLTTQLDSALTNLRIVTGENNEGAQELMLTYNKLGKELGATTQQIAESANEWLRQGYSAQEAGDLIDASMKLSKLGMIESSEATQYLTSMLKGFKMEAEKALEIVDRLTSVDIEAAVSAGGIAEALSRTATSAQLAGLSLDESIGMVTVIGEVTQKSMESVGESVKTLLSRYGNVKAGVFTQMGLDDDGETTDNINDIEKVLGKLGIPIRSSNLEMRAISDVLDDLADKWQTLDTVSKNAVATAMAGVRQRENFNVLMENYSRAEELAEKSADSAGTANEKYEAYADSFEAAMSRLTAAWEEFTLKLQSSTIVKTGIKTVTFFIENLDKIASLLATIATTIAGIKMQRGQSKLFGKIWAGGQPLRMLNKGLFGENLGGKFNTYLGARIEARNKRRGKEGLFYWDETDSTQRAKDKLSGPFAAWNKNNPQNALTQALQENTAAITGNTAAIRGETVSGQTQDMVKGFDAKKYQRTIQYKADRKTRKLWGKDTMLSANIGIDPKTGKLSLMDNEGNFSGIAPNRAMRKAYNKEVFGTGFGKPSFGQGMGAALGGITSFIGGALSMNEAGGSNSWASSLINQTGQTVEADAVDKVINGATKGGITAAASLIPGIGPVVGPLLGEFVGGPLGDLFTYLRHEDELKRKERVAEAKEQLEMLSSISDKLTGMEDLMDNEDWDADDYKQARESAEAIADELKGTKNGEENLEKWLRSMNIVDENGAAITDFNEAIKYLYSDDAEIRTKIYQAASLAVLEDIRDNTAASQEEERYNANNIETQWFIDDLVTDDMIWEDGGLGVQNDHLRQALKDHADELKGVATYDNASGQFKVLGDTNEEIAENLQKVIDTLSGDSRVSNATLKFLQSKLDNVENAIDTLDDLDKQNRQTNVELGYVQSGVGNLTSEELEGETVDSLISQIANKIEGARDQAGRITKDYYDDIKQYLREQQEMSSVFAGEGLTVQELKEVGEKWTGKVAEITAPATGERPGAVSNDWTEWEDALETNNLQRIWELAGYTGAADGEQVSAWLNRLYGTVAQADPQNIRDIAWALGVTEEALRNIDALGDIDLSDALLAPDEIREKYASAVGLWQTLIKEGSLSAEELEQVYSQYPETVGKSFDEVREILQSKVTGEQEALYQQALFGDIMESEDYLDQIVEELEGNKNLSQYQDKINEIKNAGSLSAARAIIANLGDGEWAPLLEALQAAMDDTIQYELYDDEYLNSYMSYYSDYLSEQIDALEEQKDAIGAVNEERKKELDLIKAEMALENAGKEKKKVWREGVGWTWVTDEEGVKEAQEALEEKQAEKRQDDVQLQIDYLEAQKEFIEGLPDREQMENYKQTFGEFNNAISDGAEIVSMFVNRLQEFNIKDLFWGEGGYNQATEIRVGEKASALDAAEEKFNDAVEALNNSTTMEEYFAAVSDYNAAVSELQAAYGEAKEAGVDVSGKSYAQAVQKTNGYGTDSEHVVSDAGQLKQIQEDYDPNNVLLVGSGLGAGDRNMGKLSDTVDTYASNRLSTQSGKFRYKVPNKDGTYPDEWKIFTGSVEEAKAAIRSLPANTVFNLGKHDDESKYQYRSTTGYVYKKEADDGVDDLRYIDFGQGGDNLGRWDRDSGSSTSGAKVKDKEQWGENADGTKAGEFIWKFLVSPGGVAGWLELASWAEGTTSAPGGPTLINEEGTEALITPQGTLTALPAKTGVLPADITENLWKLGGIAPSLISTLSSLTSSPYSSSNAGSTVNNSGTFIDNLSMQIYPTKDYDMDKFLEEARAKARLSRNNN